MKKWHLIAILAAFFAAVAFLLFSAPDNTSNEPATTINTVKNRPPEPEGEVTAEVRMKENAYEPAEVTVKAGQAVKFVNASNSNRWPASNIHPTHELYPEFDPRRELKPGESWTFTFQKSGVWRMHDHMVPYVKGVITVE